MNKIIVCAACRQHGLIVTGARHFDKLMVNVMVHLGSGFKKGSAWEQGFIDQYGTFYNRKDAYVLVQYNGQPFNIMRNGAKDVLYSEGLY